MRVAFFGLPLAAFLLAKDGHTIVHAALCRPRCPGERRLRNHLGDTQVTLRPDAADPSFVERLRGLEPDIVISWFWTTRLPKAILDLAPLGAFGVHPSLLPRHRGPDPYFWTIDAGDEETGVTAHRLDEDYDTGPILGQKRLAMNETWNAWTLAKRLDRPSLALLREMALAYARGCPPVPTLQKESDATEAPTPSDESLELDWSLSSRALTRRIRAASPHPGAYTFFGDDSLVLTRVAEAESYPKFLEPGEAAVLDGKAIIRTGDGALALLQGYVDDDTRPDGTRWLETDDLATFVQSHQETA